MAKAKPKKVVTKAAPANVAKVVQSISVDVDLRVLRAFAAFASTDETRFYLSGVHVSAIKGGVTYAVTDGHRMAVRREPVHEQVGVGSILVPASVCKQISKADLKSITADARGVLKIAPGGKSSLALPDREIHFEGIDGTFPDWWRCVPSHCTGKPAQFNESYVKAFATLANDLEVGSAFIHHSGPSDPCPVTFSAINHDALFGILMPMRREGGTWVRPAWLPKLPAEVKKAA